MSKKTPYLPLARIQAGLLSTMMMPLNERANLRNRSIVNYKPNYPIRFLNPDCIGNTNVSGGSGQMRSSILCQQIELAQSVGMPVVILHEGNVRLAQQIAGQFSQDPEYVEVSYQRPCFEPVYDLSDSEVTDQFWQITPQRYALKPEARYSLDGAIGYLRALKIPVSAHNLLQCQQVELIKLVDDANNQGAISDADAQSLKARLMYGQTEKMKLDLILSDYLREVDAILWKKGGGVKPENILSAIRRKKILLFDILSVGSEFLFNTVIYQLRRAMTSGLRFLLIVDSLSVQANNQFAEMLKIASQKVSLTLASDDLYAAAGGDERLFQSLVGRANVNFILRHSTAASAKKWAETCGEYDAWIQSSNRSFGSQSNPGSPFSSYTSNYGTSLNRQREFIVKPEEITRMNDAECYILTGARGEISHLLLLT